MSTDELAWLAGLLEGEGTFIFRPTGIAIQCFMTDKDVIERCKTITGLGNLYTKYRAEGFKTAYSWQVNTRNEVVVLLKQLLPYMGIRRSLKIKALLKWHEENPLKITPKYEAEHGTPTMYSRYGCRCLPCKQAWSKYGKERYRRAHPIRV